MVEKNSKSENKKVFPSDRPEARREYYNIHKERIRYLCKVRYRQKREQIRAWYKEYESKNKDKYKEYQRRKYLKYRDKYSNDKKRPRAILIDLLGKRCSNSDCLVPGGCVDVRCLHIDHINGGGGREKYVFGHWDAMYKYYVKHPDEARTKLQILCANCNAIKMIVNKESRRIFFI